jgi:hypothetical protein
MNSRAIPLLALYCAGLAACEPATVRPSQRDVYAVYAAVLDSFPPAQARPVRVSRRTWPHSLARALGDTSTFYRSVQADTGVGSALLAAFDSLNARPTDLCVCFPPGGGVIVVPDTVRPDTPGPFALSQVAFASDRGHALVSVGHSCGPLCGGWALYLVAPERGKWRVVRRLLSGVS